MEDFETGRFRGEVEARLDGQDDRIDGLTAGLARVETGVTDIKLLLARQNGLRSLAKTGGAGAGGVGLIYGLIEAFKALS